VSLLLLLLQLLRVPVLRVVLLLLVLLPRVLLLLILLLLLLLHLRPELGAGLTGRCPRRAADACTPGQCRVRTPLC
jgi:hypothetical protein